MEKRNKRKTALSTILLAILILSSTILAISTLSETPNASAAISTTELLKYEWSQLAHDDAHTRFSEGPAPDRADLIRTLPATPSSLFDGKYWYTSGGRLYARDAFTDEIKVNASLPRGGSAPTKLDDTHLYLDITGGVAIHKISDGSYVSSFNVGNVTGVDVWGQMPGSHQYSGFQFSYEYKWRYRMHYNLNTQISDLVAIDMSNPQNPHLGWVNQLNESSEILSFGDGKLFVGSTNGYCITALNATTGTVVWEARKIGYAGYSATYYNGKLYHFGSSTRLTCYDGKTGDVVWDYDAGGRAFSSYGGCAAYGRVYWHCIDPYGGYVGCWNAETGNVEWKTPAWYSAGYIDPAIADGKLYYVRSDGSTVAGRPAPRSMFTCFDAFSGEILWEIPGSVSAPMIAYGNLYCGNRVFSTAGDPSNWSYFRGDMNNPGVAANRTGPADLSKGPVWKFATDGPITSSPAVVAGKAYVGSYDKNWYCIDAYTGEKIWNFTIAHRVQSSPAVYGGRVYTGADDGYFRCLNANTGTEIWKTNIYAENVPEPFTEIASFQPRSSPIIVGNRFYCGALNGNVYCLDTSDGEIQWTFETEDPILGSPAYSENKIFITSTDKNVYALDAISGTKIWNWTSPMSGLGLGYRFHLYLVSTPMIAEGRVFIGIGASWDNYLTGYDSPTGYPGAIHFAALDANTGDNLWVANQSGNSQQPFAATYYNGRITLPNGTAYNTGPLLMMPEQMGISIYNATNGQKLWSQWLGHQVFTSVALAEDVRVGGLKMYAGSDSYGITCFNGTAAILGETVTVLSEYTAGAQCPSSPAVYAGRLYACSADGNLYCFDDSPTVTSSVWADSNKGDEMWNNETLMIAGRLTMQREYPNPFDPTFIERLTPGVPYATVIVSFNRPDSSSENVTTTADYLGYFNASYKPSQVGEWGWVVLYEGQIRPSVKYDMSYSEYKTVNVVAAPSVSPSSPAPTATPVITPVPTGSPEPSPTPQITVTPTATPPPTVSPTTTPTPTAVPTSPASTPEPSSNIQSGLAIEYVYAAIAVVIVVLVVAVAYLFNKRKMSN